MQEKIYIKNFMGISLLIIFFILAFIYFYFFGNYVLFVQEKQTLFILSEDFLKKYLIIPGGILELIGDFLSRFYIYPLIGTLILSISLILPWLVMLKINKRLLSDRAFSFIFILVPACLLLLMQTHYYHKLHYNLGFLSILLYFLFSVRQKKRRDRYIVLSLFPLVYYLTGAYIWIFTGMYIFYNLIYEKGSSRYISIFLIIVAGISLFIFKSYLFLQPVDQLLFHPLPMEKIPKYSIFFYWLSGYLVIYPLATNLIYSIKISKKIAGILATIIIIIIFSSSVLLLSKLHNPQTRLVFQLEKYVQENKWNDVIELHEANPSRNLIGQYYYNIALSETGQLCDRLFKGNQDFRHHSLILPWGNEHMNRGAYFYYSIGLINEAHRWAYESMVTYGYRPQNVKMLVKTNLINGNYRMAKKYIALLKKSVNYRGWANDYEKLLLNSEDIQSHPQLSEKLKLLPEKDFFILTENPENNILLILQSNPNNIKAFEYELAWFLLTKNIAPVIDNIKRIKEFGYKRIPKHIEEAILIDFNINNKIPDLYDFEISRETLSRFQKYVAAYKQNRQNLSLLKKNMSQKFGDTYWYYYHFK